MVLLKLPRKRLSANAAVQANCTLIQLKNLISKPFLEAAEGEETAFHASGREDIDARMLGTGRPFVVEISKPKKRILDLKKIEETINVGAKGQS